MKKYRRALALLSCLFLCSLVWFPSWRVCCKESSSPSSYYSQGDNCVLENEDEHFQKKEETDKSTNTELFENTDSAIPSPPEHTTLVDDYSIDEQDSQSRILSSPVVETLPSVDINGDSSSIAANFENGENNSTSSTSEITPVSKPNDIENSSADIPLASLSEIEESETDCNIGGSLYSDPQVEKHGTLGLDHHVEHSAFVRSPESLVGQHIENVSSSQDNIMTKSEFESDTPNKSNSDHQKPALNASEELPDYRKSGDDPTAVVSSKDPGDIPTFDEWKKKVMEVEKEKSQSMHPSSNGGQHSTKKVQKIRNNYASVECGAKILAANPEAKSTSAILIENMDLYMLNPCSTKIWFVIELCEPIQVKQFDIANYELFSSTPKDFLVSISDRYPTSKWIKLGTFHGRDERTVQSFPLDEQMYAKYVKVELLSHFGSEHFCPLSLIRVFGTSMVEEYEEIADSQYQSERQELFDEDYDYPLDYSTGEDKSSKNLLGSATNAILNMVNIAANILGAKTEDLAETEGNKSISENAPATAAPQMPDPEPSPIPLPEFVTADGHLPAVEPPFLDSPKEGPIVQLVQEDDEEPSPSTVTLLGNDEQEEEAPAWFEPESQTYCSELATACCVSSFSEYLLKWCSVKIALSRQRSRMTGNREMRSIMRVQPSVSLTTKLVEASGSPPQREELDSKIMEREVETAVTGNISSVHEDLINQTQDALELEPSQSPAVSQSVLLDATPEIKSSSKAEVPEPIKHEVGQTVSQLFPQESIVEGYTETERKSEGSMVVEKHSVIHETNTAGEVRDSSTRDDGNSIQMILKPSESILLPEHTASVTDGEDEEAKVVTSDPHKLIPPPLVESSPATDIRDEEQAAEEALLAIPVHGGLQRTAPDFYAELQNSTDLGYANGNLVHGSNQKESVFMRLNNRIKALEVNMSLSGRYLEELSQRYRKQMEEMQKAFNKTIIKLQNTSRIAEEQDQRQTEAIQLLQAQLTNMTQLVSNLSTTVSELKREVSDRQSYLVISLVLCVILGLMLCMQRCRNASQFDGDYISKLPKNNHYPSPKRCFSSYDDLNLKRRTSFPLIRSKSLQLTGKEVDPDDLYIVEPLKFSPEKKKKRCKYKSEKIETVKPAETSHPVANGDLKGRKPFTNQRDFSNMGEVYHSSYKGPPSEGSSETSSQSEESYFCGISACTSLCNGQTQKTKTEKRALKRRRSRVQDQGKLIKTLIQTKSGSMPSLHDLIKGNKEITVGTFGVTAVSGHL